MNAQAATTFLTNAEFIFWLAAFVAALATKLQRQFSSVVYFLVVRLLISGGYAFLNIYFPPGSPGSTHAYSIYFEGYWAAYFVATLAVFFSIEQIIRQVLSPLPGLSKLGVIIFRFTGGMTFFIALTAHLPEMRSLRFDFWLNALYISFALCMCVFEITLMGVLVATAQRLGLNFRTRIFGLGLGFCFLGMMDLFALVTAAVNTAKWAGASLASEVVVILTLLLWMVYFLRPEQRRGALAIHRSSTLMRWNEIVSQLGMGPQPQTEAMPSFMADVEDVVERIMLRNQRAGG